VKERREALTSRYEGLGEEIV
jgi:hypothetical protein